MPRLALPRLSSSGPTNMLGRWCTPSYNRLCSQEMKADLANHDNSAGAAPLRRVESEDVDACPWSNPTFVTFLYGYGT